MSETEPYESPAAGLPPLAQVAEERYARYHPEDPAVSKTVPELKAIAAQQGVSVKGTGTGGSIVKDDLVAALTTTRKDA